MEVMRGSKNCRLNKENDIADMKKKETRLQTENKRLRAELLVLQKTCTNLRAERDKAMDAEQAAQVRAAAFQSDRDKVQRNFKVNVKLSDKSEMYCHTCMYHVNDSILLLSVQILKLINRLFI